VFKLKKIVKSVCALGLVMGILAGTGLNALSVSAALTDNWLSMSPNTTGVRYLVDSAGNPFNMFAMARSQYCAPFDENPHFDGVEGLCEYYKSLGCNTIRLAVTFNTIANKNYDLVQECGGYNEDGYRRFVDRYVDPEVRAIINSGMYVILDLHEYPVFDDPEDPDPQKLIDFARSVYIPLWGVLAKKYADEPMIAMYELWNEPYAADEGSLGLNSSGRISDGKYRGYDWNEQVRQFYIDCAAEVRKYDKKHVMLISDYNAGWGRGWGLTWAKDPYAADPVQKNIIFSVHCNSTQFMEQKTTYEKYWPEQCDRYNIGFHFGEVENEREVDSNNMNHFIDIMEKLTGAYHFSIAMWRPHPGTERNRVDLWTDFAKKYSTPVTVLNPTSPASSDSSENPEASPGQSGSSQTAGGKNNPGDVNIVLVAVIIGGTVLLCGAALALAVLKRKKDMANSDANPSEEKE